MGVLIARRLLAALATLAVVSMLLFAAVEVLPGDAARQSLGPTATPAQVEIRRAELGLDRPAVARYAQWVSGAVRGDLGTSLASQFPVRELIGVPLLNTVMLGAIALVVVTVVTVLFGLLAGSRPGAPRDRAISTLSVLVVSLPEFVVAALLVFVLSWQLGWFEPVSLTPTGNVLDRPSAMVLPALSVTLVGAAFAVRLARAAIADVGRLPHVESARLQGVPEHRVLLRYVLPSALGPIAQVLSFVTIFLTGGTIIVEQFFDYPGLGKLLVGSVRARDLPVVEGIGLLLGEPARRPARAPDRPMIELRELTVRDTTGRVVVDKVSFEVPEGGTLGIVGGIRRRQALNPTMRLGAQLAELCPSRPSPEQISQRLAVVGLPTDPAVLRRYPHELSGGQQQRVTLANDPRFVILDEPTTGLDVVTEDLVLVELARQRQRRAVQALRRPLVQRRAVQLVPQDPLGSFNPRRSVGAAIARPSRPRDRGDRRRGHSPARPGTPAARAGRPPPTRAVRR